MTQEYTGKSLYFADLDEGSSNLLVAVACFVEDLPQRLYALMDTASAWCVLPPSVAVRLGLDLANDEEATPLSTRFGTLIGRLERVSLTFDASEGRSMTIQVDLRPRFRLSRPELGLPLAASPCLALPVPR